MTAQQEFALSLLDSFKHGMTTGDMPPVLTVWPEGSGPSRHVVGDPGRWPDALHDLIDVIGTPVAILGGVDGRGQRVDGSLLEQATTQPLPDMVAVFVAGPEEWTFAVVNYDKVGGEFIWGEPYLPDYVAGSLSDLVDTLRHIAWPDMEDDQ